MLLAAMVLAEPPPAAAAKSAGGAKPAGGAVDELLLEWRDAARQRTLPVKCYLPVLRPGAAAPPVILFSHGLGGSRTGYSYLGRYWAEHGLAVVHLQHPGSDETVWRGKGPAVMENLRGAVNLKQSVERLKDVAFAVAELQRLARKEGRFHGRLDPERIGMAGHSFGANTTLWAAAVAGGFPVPGVPPLPEIKAAVLLSPSPAGLDAVYPSIRIPCLHLTGTEDHSPIRDMTLAQRREPFERITGVPEYLVVFTGGDHLVFSDRNGPRAGWGQGKNRALDGRLQPAIQQATLAFWKAFLQGSKPARNWLDGQGKSSLAGLIGPLGELRRKTP